MPLRALRARNEKYMGRTVPEGSEPSLASRPRLQPFTVHLTSTALNIQQGGQHDSLHYRRSGFEHRLVASFLKGCGRFRETTASCRGVAVPLHYDTEQGT